ncbi:hypothetical protein N7535_005595 [Penicillium sp. DV-2018c]|nr:hypothetical protein N7461_009169 [Penicillium sp. DV-2018c]KAJ5571935.1 hypothetical protein N7535_005595 [Penicillium sp. DV-2018c]
MDNMTVPIKPRRQQSGLACEECRSRKLKCDMGVPQCGTCYNLGVTCITNPLRRPRGPRKGHVKTLKSRIATLERQLYGTTEIEARPGTPTSRGGTKSPGEEQLMRKSINDDAGEHVTEITPHSGADYTEYLMGTQPLELSGWASTMPLDFETHLDKQMNGFPSSSGISSPSPLIAAPKPTSPLVMETSFLFPDLTSQPMSLPPIATQPPVQLTALECADLYVSSPPGL